MLLWLARLSITNLPCVLFYITFTLFYTAISILTAVSCQVLKILAIYQLIFQYTGITELSLTQILHQVILFHLVINTH